MRRDDSTRLRHMLDASRLAIGFSTGLHRTDLEGDPRTVLAMVKAIEIVGEAASHISPVFQSMHPEIPWSRIVSTRNRLVHAYFDVDLDVLWSTIVADLPPLIDALEAVLASEQP